MYQTFKVYIFLNDVMERWQEQNHMHAYYYLGHHIKCLSKDTATDNQQTCLLSLNRHQPCIVKGGLVPDM